jgi:hypothetical protein
LANLTLEIVPKEKLNKRGETQNYSKQTFELTPFLVEMDVDITILFVAYGPHVSMPKFIPSYPNAIPRIAKEKPKPKKLINVKKFQNV